MTQRYILDPHLGPSCQMSVKALLLAFIAIKLSASALSHLWPAHPWLQRLVKSTKSGLKCIIRCSLQPSPPNSTCLINLYIESHQAKAKPSPRRLAWVGRNKAVSYYFQKKQSRAWGRTENKVESEIWKHCTFLSHDKDRLWPPLLQRKLPVLAARMVFPSQFLNWWWFWCLKSLQFQVHYQNTLLKVNRMCHFGDTIKKRKKNLCMIEGLCHALKLAISTVNRKEINLSES